MVDWVVPLPDLELGSALSSWMPYSGMSCVEQPSPPVVQGVMEICLSLCLGQGWWVWCPRGCAEWGRFSRG